MKPAVPKSPEIFEHDTDGNLTADGQWRYTWDAENRLIAIETLPALVAPAGPLPAERKRKVEFIYDAQHRRVARKAYSWNTASSTWALTADTRYLYDGWNVIAEFEASPSAPSTFTLTRSYAWGLDLSGTLQGAGGVGGLVFARLHSGATSVTHAAASDGNGNVLAYYNAAIGERTARFEYGPFGEPLVDDGPSAEGLTYRFSTKPRDPHTGTYYYGYRHYVPTTGRWPSRDPIEEEGGANLYGFVQNGPINRIDLLGRWSPEAHDKLIYYAYWDRLNDGDIFIIQMSSREFDKATQSSGEAYKHSMARRGQTPTDAAKQRDAFIAETIARAREAWRKCDRDKALRLLGEAAHPLMDSSSPLHVDEFGNPRTWIPWWPFGHSPTEFIGSERAKHLTREIIHDQQRRLNQLFDEVFGAGTKLK